MYPSSDRGGREAAIPRGGSRRFGFGDRTRASSRRSRWRCRLNHSAGASLATASSRCASIARRARPMDWARRRVTRRLRGSWAEMEDPVSCRLVLPLTRFEQVAHDGYRSCATDALGPLNRARETEDLMATCREDLDQLRANESVGSVINVVATASPGMRPVWNIGRRATTHSAPTNSHNARTTAVRWKVVKPGAFRSFGAQLKSLREGAGFTQEELATIAGLSVHGVSALERGERRRPHVETVRALCAALDLTGETRDALLESASTSSRRGGRRIERRRVAVAADRPSRARRGCADVA